MIVGVHLRSPHPLRYLKATYTLHKMADVMMIRRLLSLFLTLTLFGAVVVACFAAIIIRMVQR